MKKTILFLLCLALFTLFVLPSCGLLAGKLPSFVSPESGIKDITLPAGFTIEVFARDLKGARSLSLGPDGFLFVGSRDAGNVYALRTTSELRADV